MGGDESPPVSGAENERWDVPLTGKTRGPDHVTCEKISNADVTMYNAEAGLASRGVGAAGVLRGAA